MAFLLRSARASSTRSHEEHCFATPLGSESATYAPKPFSITKSMFPSSCPGRYDVNSTGKPSDAASAIVPGPALLMSRSAPTMYSPMFVTKPSGLTWTEALPSARDSIDEHGLKQSPAGEAGVVGSSFSSSLQESFSSLASALEVHSSASGPRRAPSPSKGASSFSSTAPLVDPGLSAPPPVPSPSLPCSLALASSARTDVAAAASAEPRRSPVDIDDNILRTR
mmetsp:Transcript_10133/g.20259  ORF Transcript_10133/g.20259 Transcript_10133/m.20259 type:complete len:224 (-) Transcript_10133:396-1067(-)